MSDGLWSFLGALIAALLGAYVLLNIARKTAAQVQSDLKTEKLAEAKRDIFLELVDHWMHYLMVINSFRINCHNDYRQAIFRANNNLVASLHKSSFISDPKTKLAVMDFTFDLTLKNIDLSGLVNIWYNVESKRQGIEESILKITEDLSNKAQLLQIILREELGIENNEDIDLEIVDMKNSFVNSLKI